VRDLRAAGSSSDAPPGGWSGCRFISGLDPDGPICDPAENFDIEDPPRAVRFGSGGTKSGEDWAVPLNVSIETINGSGTSRRFFIRVW
jgi:hypothetical protein